MSQALARTGSLHAVTMKTSSLFLSYNQPVAKRPRYVFRTKGQGQKSGPEDPWTQSQGSNPIEIHNVQDAANKAHITFVTLFMTRFELRLWSL